MTPERETMKVRFFDIVWDTTESGSLDQLKDSPAAAECGLPSEVTLEVDTEGEDDPDAYLDEEAANILSDKFGYCVFSCSYEIL
jgi:hypothetical protein